MPARPRRPEKRDDIRTETAVLGGVGVVVALVGWSLFARQVAGVGCGPACSQWPRQVAAMVFWLVLALGGTLTAAAAYVVSAVSRLLGAAPERPERDRSLSAGSADD